MPGGTGMSGGRRTGGGGMRLGNERWSASGGGGRNRGGRGRNRGGAFGPGGFCVCTACGRKVPHERGRKCTTLKCPDCGRTMVREELLESRTKGEAQ